MVWYVCLRFEHYHNTTTSATNIPNECVVPMEGRFQTLHTIANQHLPHSKCEACRHAKLCTMSFSRCLSVCVWFDCECVKVCVCAYVGVGFVAYPSLDSFKVIHFHLLTHFHWPLLIFISFLSSIGIVN